MEFVTLEDSNKIRFVGRVQIKAEPTPGVGVQFKIHLTH